MKKVMSIIPVIILSLMLFTGCEEEKASTANDTTTTPTITEDEVTSSADSSLIEQPDNSKYPYLSAIQNSLDCVFNNDEEGYLNVQHPEVRKMHETLYYPATPIEGEYNHLIKQNLNNNMHRIKEIYSHKGITAAEMVSNDELFSGVECSEQHLITLSLESNDPNEECARCACLVYMVDDKWYAFFWDGSINCAEVE